MARRFQKSVFSPQEEVPIDRRPRILSLPILGLILVGLIASGLSDVLPRFLRFLLVFAVYSYLPGVALIRWAIPARWRAAEIRLPLAAISGLSLFLVVSWVCWILGLPFSSYVAVLQGAAVCVFAFSLFVFYPTISHS